MSKPGKNMAYMHTRKDAFPMGPSHEDGQELRKIVCKVGRCRDTFVFRKYADRDLRPYQIRNPING